MEGDEGGHIMKRAVVDGEDQGVGMEFVRHEYKVRIRVRRSLSR